MYVHNVVNSATGVNFATTLGRMADIDSVLDEIRNATRDMNHPVGDVPGRRNRDPRDAEDSNYRKAYGQGGRRPFGKPLRAAFYHYLPDVPLTRYLPADFAQNYLRKIHEVQEMQCWSRKERERLRQLERRWAKRAAGKDSRYNRLGTKPGRECRNRPPSPRDRIDAICAQLRGEMPAETPTPFGTWKPR